LKPDDSEKVTVSKALKGQNSKALIEADDLGKNYSEQSPEGAKFKSIG